MVAACFSQIQYKDTEDIHLMSHPQGCPTADLEAIRGPHVDIYDSQTIN